MLDNNLKFITVIPEDKIHDKNFLNKAIEENRKYSVANRDEIISYSKQRSWSGVAKIYNNYL
jgi:hypothetical protein